VQHCSMRLRARAKWLWDRVSDISLAKDLFVGLGASGLLKMTLTAAAGAIAAGLGYAEHIPATIILLVALLAMALAFWLINQVQLLLAGRQSAGGISAPGPQPLVWLSRNWGPFAMIGGVAMIAMAWPLLDPAAPSPAPATKATARPTAKVATVEKPSPKKASVKPSEVVTARPQIVYLPASPSPTKRPESSTAKIDPAPAGGGEPASPASPVAPVQKEPTQEEKAAARWTAIVTYMRVQRDKGDTLFVNLRDVFYESEIRNLFFYVDRWDRETADLVGDYSGAQARNFYLSANSVKEKIYEPDKGFSPTLAAKRVEFMNLIRSRQRALSELYTRSPNSPAAATVAPSSPNAAPAPRQ